MFWVYKYSHLQQKKVSLAVIGVLGILEAEAHLAYMGVSKNRGIPKSSILVGFSIINHPFLGTPISGNTHIDN